MKTKYLFTQISAPFVACICALGTIFLLRYVFGGWINIDKVSHVIVLGSIVITVCVVSIAILGKVYVWTGVLTKDEAKGYPFSKPWEKEKVKE